MKTLLIDNYDSFTYNLFQILAAVNGEEPVVVRNDEATWEELARLRFDNVVVSPGPGRPDREDDFGVCAEVIRRCETPLLGVCLGHQGLGAAHGAAVEPAPRAMHGRVSAVAHDGTPLFAGMPRQFLAVRYHSLQVAPPLPPELEPIAWTEGGEVMALAHRRLPQWGVQFHPESVSTEHGARLLANFRDLTPRRAQTSPATLTPRSSRNHLNGGAAMGSADRRVDALPRFGAPGMTVATQHVLRVEHLDRAPDPESAFVRLYGESDHAFWLDGSGPDGAAGDAARFSFMGDASGPLAALVSYDVEACEVRTERRGEEVEVSRESIFDYLGRETARLRPASRAAELPFEFDGGFVGYLGYELKAECGGEAAHRSDLPDAAFIRADRVLAFDRRDGGAYLLALAEDGDTAGAERWLAATRRRLAALPPPPSDPPPGRGVSFGPMRSETHAAAGSPPEEPPEFRLARPRGRYLEDIEECKRLLAEGETYEVCLTNQVSVTANPEPLPLYRRLRRLNPAPFGVYLRFGDAAVLSSSPERFLRVGSDRGVETKPIKGTCRRGATPAEDARLAAGLREGEKTRAENLMVADLLRNDLGSVCEVGSVHVPELMNVESYETVHQLVTTIRGRLREGVDAPGCARACFPGGSMTGAPKRRTMEVIDRLEGEARGVYSGAIGWFGVGGGCDLSVVIRTIVLDGESAAIGVGGAIVAQSDAEEEFREILLKGEAPMRALAPGVDPLDILRLLPETDRIQEPWP